ncbi:hypothetical protein HAX54_046691 [Datura stramonium]|uniref:Uncharacterized protein n=1 Tax=Datura stramonium TaxID=4076 RepID=A0ABS8WLA6_DATST|nr:hypothetical protein [Datura stramonium]
MRHGWNRGSERLWCRYIYWWPIRCARNSNVCRQYVLVFLVILGEWGNLDKWRLRNIWSSEGVWWKVLRSGRVNRRKIWWDSCTCFLFGKWHVQANGNIGEVPKSINFTLYVGHLLHRISNVFIMKGCIFSPEVSSSSLRMVTIPKSARLDALESVILADARAFDLVKYG